MPNRDIIAIGASAGGVEALQKLVSGLPADFPAAVLVVMHLPSQGRSFLPQVLSTSGPLPANEAQDGERIDPGRIYVAPSDYHLLVSRGHIHLIRGPKEGRQRPSINVTFRSVAMAYYERAIGVVMTGMLDDGTAGLWEIKNRGGLAVVQDPDDAVCPSMPVSAMQDVAIDHRATAAEMGSLLNELVRSERSAGEDVFAGYAGPRFCGVTCPECRGPVFEIERNGLFEFQCRSGHHYSTTTLLDEHMATQERKLFEAIVMLDEGADLSEYLAPRVEVHDRERLVHQAEELRQQANFVRHMMQERKSVGYE
jgi:two-component system chemotaxis response regulator CheB